MKIVWSLFRAALLSQTQHRASFMMLFCSYCLSTGADILSLWVLFDRFQMIRGWTFSELALVYGIVHMGFSLAETTARGFDDFDTMIKNGDFDRLLLRPLSPLLQLAVSRVEPMRLGRFVQGFCMLLWGLSSLPFSLSFFHLCLIIFSIVSTASLFFGLWILQATACFWFTEILEVFNIATFGGAQMGQFPITVYSRGMQWIFTILVPLSCVAYYPIASVLGKSTLPLSLACALPLAGFVFLWLSCQCWKVGVRRYSSTGS